MKIIFESWAEFFSDEAEDMLFCIGEYAPLPPQATYNSMTKEVVDCYGCFIDTCKSIKEFKEKYKNGVVWKPHYE